ncbi:MAG: flagellar hook-length control protein [Massilia sp.]|nr:flagellar hook-length control protein [Massilia sp.]
MSIAVSAVIKPSRMLRLALLCFGAANLGAGAALFVYLAPMSVLVWLGAAAMVLTGTLILRCAVTKPKVRRIDISGLGQLRMTVQQHSGTPAGRAEIVQMLAGSTIWPGMMVLRCRQENGQVRALVILPDSIEAGQFRHLSVALRDVASRKT